MANSKHKNWLIALVLGLTGIFVLYFSATNSWLQGHPAFQTVLENIGALLLVTVAFQTIWNVGIRKDLIDMVLSKVKIRDEITKAGIVDAERLFTDLDWGEILSEVKELDIFFTYAHSWRQHNADKLKEIATRREGKIRVVLPDPEEDELVAELARRFDSSPNRIKEHIYEAKDFFQEMYDDHLEEDTVEVFFFDSTPRYSYYRVDDKIIVAFYKHTSAHYSVPTLIIEKGGTWYNYFRKEFSAMVHNEERERVRPAPTSGRDS